MVYTFLKTAGLMHHIYGKKVESISRGKIVHIGECIFQVIDGRLYEWNTRQFRFRCCEEVQSPGYDLYTCGRNVLIRSHYRCVQVYNVDKKNMCKSFILPEDMNVLSISSDKRFIYVVVIDGSEHLIHVYDPFDKLNPFCLIYHCFLPVYDRHPIFVVRGEEIFFLSKEEEKVCGYLV